MINKTIGIIGCGNMGQAIIAGLTSSGLVKRKDILAADSDKSKTNLVKKFKINIVKLNEELVSQSDVIILAVKPQVMEAVLDEIKDNKPKNKLIVSIAAGITTGYIEKKLGQKAKVVRVMPNTPALVQEAMSALCAGKKAAASDLKLALNIFECLGEVVVVREDLFDAVTAISGCGPAYYFYLCEILINLSQENGLSRELAQKIVKQTFLGSAKLLNQSKDDAQILRHKITSKGGVTEAAFKILEKRKTRKIFKEAILYAVKRSKELSR